MGKQSAGLLMYRFSGAELQIFLVHPGGPFWAKKDDGVWSIPKGEYADGEEPLAAARREFLEETGFEARGKFTELTPIRQTGGKVVKAWAFAGDCDATAVKSSSFTMEWPPKSGRQAEFPEVDRGEWFPVDMAKQKILKSQVPLVDQLCAIVDDSVE